MIPEDYNTRNVILDMINDTIGYMHDRIGYTYDTIGQTFNLIRLLRHTRGCGGPVQAMQS
jgi:hypothetical protein